MPWFLNSLVSSVAHRSGKEISALDNTFALIDEYIDEDLLSFETFPWIHAADHTLSKFLLTDSPRTLLAWDRFSNSLTLVEG